MISWIQRTFQQHFKTLFLILLGGLIISFVFTIGAMPSSSVPDAGSRQREFFGVNLNNRETQERIFGDAQLSVTLQAGYNALDGARLQQYALSRQAALAVADDLGLPAPSDREIVEYVQTLRMFQGESGKFDAKRYEEFRDSLKTNPRITEADISRVLANDVVHRRVVKLLAGPGYVLPADVAEQLTVAESIWSVDIANIDTSAFKPSIATTDADLTAFFADNAGRYEIPARTRVDYIAFPVDAKSVAVTDEELLSTYLANPARFPAPDAKDKVDGTETASAFDDFAKVKPQVEAVVRSQKARRAAGQAAADLALELFENKVGPDALGDFLAKRNLTLKSAAPVGPDSVPAELAGIPQIAETAARLGANQPYSDALAGAEQAVILVWRETLPARQPELAEVRAQVESDYQADRLRERLAAAGKSFHDDLSARLKTGAKFADAATAAAKAAGLSVETKRFEGFTFNEPPEGLDYTALNALQNLSAGELSPVVNVSRDKAILLRVADKKLPDLTPANPRYDEIKERIATVLAQRNGEDALAALVEQELARTAPAAP